MKTSHRWFLATLACLTLAATAAQASQPIRTPGHFGLGIGLTTLSNGLSAKYFLNRGSALQFGLGTLGCCGSRHRYGDWGGFGIGVDYLIELPKIATAGRAFELAWNVGPGLGVGFAGGDRYYGNGAVAFAASLVVGLEFNFIPAPLDFVIEWRPNFLFVPDVRVDPLDFTAHLRFYF